MWTFAREVHERLFSRNANTHTLFESGPIKDRGAPYPGNSVGNKINRFVSIYLCFPD